MMIAMTKSFETRRVTDIPYGALAAESLGLALYIAWSFALWNGQMLFDHITVAMDSTMYMTQGFGTALAAFVFMIAAPRLTPLFRRTYILALLAGLSCISIVLAANAEALNAPTTAVLVAFALSGVGSTLRLGWEERLSIQGVVHTALTITFSYALGFIFFVGLSLLPSLPSLVIASLMPFGACALLFIPLSARSVAHDVSQVSVNQERASRSTGSNVMRGKRVAQLKRMIRVNEKSSCQDASRNGMETSLSWEDAVKQVPWKLMVVVGLVFFSYGATRTDGVVEGLLASASGHVVVAGAPALASIVAIVLALALYKRHALVALYIAFPLMGAAALIPITIVSWGGSVAFSVALIGAELVKYLIWFMIIESIIKDAISALFVLASLRAVQWAGSLLGQVAVGFAPSHEVGAIGVFISLMGALLLIVGTPSIRNPKGDPYQERVSITSGAPERNETLLSEQQTHFDQPPVTNKLPDKSLERDASREDDPSTRSSSRGDAHEYIDRMAKHYKLSPREQEVFAIWVTGHTSSYIERKLFISKSTIKTHLNHIYTKTHCQNREQLLEQLERFR